MSEFMSSDGEDPLHNDSILLHGLRIAEPGDEPANTIRKVPSDQIFSMFRWGSNHRVSGRSKSGLQISVPGKETCKPVLGVNNEPFSGKSIIYMYTSSSSSSGKTTNSFGAVGDHSPSARSYLSTNQDLPIVHEDPAAKRTKSQSIAASRKRSPLADLIADSVPEIAPYKLLIVGETGPCGQHTAPVLISPEDFPLLPPRRRSLSDLMHNPKGSLPARGGNEVPGSGVLQMNRGSTSSHTRIPELPLPLSPVQSSAFDDGPAILENPTPPVWRRSGPPFGLVFREVTGKIIHSTPDNDLDPPEFQLPYGSKIFIMKTNNVCDLRASVTTGVWSSSKGANRVLQSAWDLKKDHEKIILLFSMTHNPPHGGKYCGMAEMCGPYQVDGDPHIWIQGLEGKQGIVPVHWILAKDVDFPVFDDLEYKGKLVTQLRHANTVPGEAGRCLVQRYFESSHSGSATIHPQVEAPSTMPINFSPRRARRSALRGTAHHFRGSQQNHPRPGRGLYPNFQPIHQPVSNTAIHYCSPIPYPGRGGPSLASPASYSGHPPHGSIAWQEPVPYFTPGNGKGFFPTYDRNAPL